MRRRGRLALAAALLAALGGAFLWTQAPPRTDEASGSGPRTAARPAVAEPMPASAATDGTASAAVPASAPPSMADEPLPPPDTPLAAVLDALEKRARRGDRRAACRLALDGQFCRANPLDADAVAFFEASIAAREHTTPDDVEWIADLEARHARAVQLCSGLPERWAEDRSGHWMLQAALQGDDALAAWYASSPPLDRNAFLERPEPWQAYRRHAVALLRRAVEAGELHAVHQWRRILAGHASLIGMPHAIAPDPRQAAVYAVALRPIAAGTALRELEQEIAAARQGLLAAEWPTLEQEGLALARRHFAGQPARDFSRGVFRDVDARRCD